MDTNINILSSLKNVRSGDITVGTHNGFCHGDELVACGIYGLLHPNLTIVRTRDSAILSQCDICIDIGGGKFDHHQKGFNKTRTNGIKYASAGLIFKEYGEELITLILKRYFPGMNCNVTAVFKAFDAKVIVPVDKEDNGKSTATHSFSFISSFLPLWLNDSPEEYDKQFQKALIITMEILEHKLREFIAKEIAKSIVAQSWKNPYYFKNGILEIPSQTFLNVGLESIVRYNYSKKQKVNFVIFPYPAGGWAAQCIPPSLKKKFSQRIPFPKSWAGQTTLLPQISSVETATFCHNGCFFIRADTKEDILKMCNIAQ